MAYTGAPKSNDSEEVLLQKLLSALGGTPYLGSSAQQTLFNLVTVVNAAGGGGGGSYLATTGGTLSGALLVAAGTVAASTPPLSFSQTWNSGATTFTGLSGAITATAAGSNSNLFNFTVDGVDRFNFTLGGSFRAVKVAADDTGPNFFLRKQGATGNASGAIASGGAIGAHQFSGWDSAAFQNGASIIVNTTEVWSGAARGTYMDFQTTTQGGTSLVSTMRLQGNKIGFFAATPVVKQASGANFTNNVTAGGSTDVIADFTNLSTYATDAAIIRNDIHQLARKVKQINDALRLYGLLD